METVEALKVTLSQDSLLGKVCSTLKLHFIGQIDGLLEI